MNPILFALPGAEVVARSLRQQLGGEAGALELHRFPDGECCPRLRSDVAGRDVVLVGALDRPDRKVMALYLVASVARELGARSVGIVAPYLPYMRQDAHFEPGDGITSAHFARLISGCCDWLATVDPHLHRHRSLGAIYSVPTRVAHAAPAIAAWIGAQVQRPILIGPDGESEQWVAGVAATVGCGYAILEKRRSGDRSVAVSIPDTSGWDGMTPVLVDDIVSTGRTMIAAAVQVGSKHLASPVCVAVHPLFAGGAYAALYQAGVERIVSCNTVEHSSNRIDIAPALAQAVRELLGGVGAPPDA